MFWNGGERQEGLVVSLGIDAAARSLDAQTGKSICFIKLARVLRDRHTIGASAVSRSLKLDHHFKLASERPNLAESDPCGRRRVGVATQQTKPLRLARERLATESSG